MSLLSSILVGIVALEPGLSLEEGREAVTSELTKAEYDRLERVLSLGWFIQEVRPAAGDASGLYRIVPASQINSGLCRTRSATSTEVENVQGEKATANK
ncbi:hypothetical protein [Paenibacillus polymyxa]|uniref:hypothetical protein n=1 Tax=Paenibacillus polymyxa TaxID=1406 RepID=UPI00287FF321|nr:hypothetical protein [Paenibacillus polymyxa]